MRETTCVGTAWVIPGSENMAVAKGLKLEAIDAGAVGAEVDARARAVRERAAALAAKRVAPVDPIVDWLEAERTIYHRPAARLALVGDRYHVDIELPGVAVKDVTIRAGDGRLVVEAKRAATAGIALLDEFGVTALWRDVTLPPDAIAGSVEATLKDGVLALVLSRKIAPVEAPPQVEAPISAARVTKRPAKRAPSKKSRHAGAD